MAREARSLRQSDLAEKLGRSPGSISKWENDESGQRPTPATLPLLADVLEVETDWFLKPLPESQSLAIFYRSMASTLELLRAKARAKLGFVHTIEEALREYVELPEVDIPDFLLGRDFRDLRKDEIGFFAEELRDYWGLGIDPIDDLLLVIENAGVVVGEDCLGSLKLDGLSCWYGDSKRPYMLLATDKSAGVRRRLDAAHELGHVVLHRNVSEAELTENFDLVEEQAMDFAGAFLMPAESFSNDVYSLSLDALLSIKAKWKVSIGAMIKRLAALDLVSPQYERRLWQYYSGKRWRGHEPLDDELPIERPQNLGAAIQLVISENACTAHGLRREIGLSSLDICSLTGVPLEIFAARPSNPTRLTPMLRKSGGENSEPDDSSENVVPFRKNFPKK